jgi:SAM-dependent methyltransferase
MQKNLLWGQRIRRAAGYIQRRDWAGLGQAIRQFLVWKGVGWGPGHSATHFRVGAGLRRKGRSLDALKRFEAFLEFEDKVFGRDFPIPAYDPYLIRYGEYRFALEMLALRHGETILDLGCAANILILFLAYLGVRALAVDMEPQVWGELRRKKEVVERATGRKLKLDFKAEDATRLTLESESIDEVIAISAIEHMFSDQGFGDQLAVAAIARVLKPGGTAVITLPMSNGGPFHESPSGDAGFGGPYRLYTPEALQERILSQPELETVRLTYLAQTTPDPRYDHLYFFRFWMESLTSDERWKWAWANAILAAVFNPIISQEEGERRLETVNTALICLRKKVGANCRR